VWQGIFKPRNHILVVSKLQDIMEQKNCDECHKVKAGLTEYYGKILCVECRYFEENGEEKER
jgi:hypothetical protein